MSVKLTALDWFQFAVSIAFMGLSAFCVLRAVAAGIAYGDTLDLPGRSAEAIELAHRADRYMYICLLLQAPTTLLLAPTLRSAGVKPESSHFLAKFGKYALALVISVFGTALAFPFLFWMMK